VFKRKNAASLISQIAYARIDHKSFRSRSMTAFEQARIDAGLTIIQLSIESNVSRSTIEKMERDEPVRAELAARACRVISQHLGREVTYQSLGIKVIS
jgi:hypothetical protein